MFYCLLIRFNDSFHDPVFDFELFITVPIYSRYMCLIIKMAM